MLKCIHKHTGIGFNRIHVCEKKYHFQKLILQISDLFVTVLQNNFTAQRVGLFAIIFMIEYL